MSRTTLQVQAAGILVLVTLVGGPQVRSVRAVSVWRTGGPLMPRPELVANDARIVDGQSETGVVKVGYGSLVNTARTRGSDSSSLIGTDDGYGSTRRRQALASLKARWNALTCMARTTISQPVPFARLVLRDAVTGRVEARATADRAGRCTFVDVATGSYVLELLDSNGSVIASSELVAIDDDDLREAIVTVGSDATVDGIFGSVQPAAGDTVNRAVDTGSEAVAPPAATNSPQQ